MGLKRAKSRFEDLDTAVGNVKILPRNEDPFQGRKVLRVSFQGEPHRYIETIESVKEDDELTQVQEGDSRTFNADKMPVLHFVAEN